MGTKKLSNGNFNYNLAYPLEDPLLISIANNFNIKREYVYVGVGSSQFISAVVSLKCWNTIFLSDIEFALYKRSALLADKKVKFLKGITTNDFMSSLKKLKSKDNDLLCISSPRWFSGELFTKSQIKEILKIFNGTIIIDEAYIDYSDDEKGKGISLDFRTKKRKFYSKDKWIVYKDNENVPPIVSEELWEKANEILDSRGNKHSSEDKSVYVKRYPLSGKIYCAHDNSLYVRGNYKLKSGKKVYWACDNYRRNGIAKSSGCKSPLLYEEELKNVFKPIIQRIINEKEEIIEEIKDILNEAKLQGSYIKEKEKYANDIKQYERQKDELFDMRSKQEITPKEFIEFKNKLDIKIDETKKAIDKIIAIEENINSSCESVETLKRNIESIILDDDNSVFEIASSLFEKIYVEVDRDSESCRKAVMHIQLKIEEMQRENLSLSQLSMLLRGDTRFCCPNWR